MLLIPLFLCIGFMLAVLYMDLVFDISALPYRRSGTNLPKTILDPIVIYYRYITKNPWLLIFVILTAASCIAAQLAFHLVSRRIGVVSGFLIGFVMLVGTLKVIPTAQRLASGKDDEERQTRMVHSLFPYHVLLLIGVLLLTVVQFSTTDVWR